MLRDPANLLPLFSAERDEIEPRWLVDLPDPATAFAESDRLLESWTARVAEADVIDTRPWWARRYWERRNLRAGI